MSSVNSQTVGTAGKNLAEKKSSPGINCCSSPTQITKLSYRKPLYDSEGKECVNISKIPRPPMTASYSFNETLKSIQSNGKTKKPPSMIPRSKSRKRNESGKVRIDIPSRAESPKKYFNKTTGSITKESGEDYEFELVTPPDNQTRKQSALVEQENKISKQEREISSVNLKSCRDDFKDKSEDHDLSYSDAQEDALSECRVARKEEEIKGPPVQENFVMDGDFMEEEKEARTIRHLYETIRCTVGPLFENLKWMHPEKYKSKESQISGSDSTMSEVVDGTESVSETSTTQEHYEFTLREISNVWKSTISLLGSVKNHAVKFVEENDRLIDKEQLALESEMLQATLDFAISYSKLKTEYLITMVRERLSINDLGSNKLENLMDSKIFATLYNFEDLAVMAQNVHDLSANFRKGEDVGLE